MANIRVNALLGPMLDHGIPIYRIELFRSTLPCKMLTHMLGESLSTRAL